MELVPGTVIAGRYRLERLLASGGMGAVWVARHLTLGSDIAIKFLHDDSPTPVARTRFEREARTASLIRHPNVVTVQDYGIEGQTPYMAMELLHGENLDDFILRKKRLTLDELEPIVSQISRGLRKAHEAGIVHRDLKPSNVFLARDESDGREVVKILDFGIAKEIDATLGQHTKTTELMGSPHYMSPEQLRSSKKSDFRSDLWSFAVIIYRGLTGVVPFPGDTLAEVMVQVFSGKYPPPSTLVQGLPPTVDAFFQRAFARKPDERYQAIADLHNAFVAVVAGKPLPAPTAAPPASPSATPIPNPSAAPPPFATSSPSWPGVMVSPTQVGAAPAVPNAGRAAPPIVALPASPDAATASLSAVDRDAAAAATAAPPAPQAPAPRASNPGLSAHPEQPMPAGTLVGFGEPNQGAHSPGAWQDNPAPIVSLPGPPEAEFSTQPLPALPPTTAPTNAPTTAPTNAPTNPVQGADPRRVRNIAIAAVAGLLVLVTIVLLAFGGSSDPADKPSSGAENSASPAVTSPPSAQATTHPVVPAAASGSAVTPDEIAAAVPDETPVEVVPDEPPAPTPSATQAPKSNWKPIGKGQGRLLVNARGGVCKITINSTYYGVTPLDVMVDAGKTRVFCRMSTGATRSKELRVPEYRLTKIEFDVKQ